MSYSSEFIICFFWEFLILKHFRVQQDLQTETKKTVEHIDTLEKQSAHMYHAEPMVDMPYIPPNTSLTQKAGYLYLRR